MLEDDDDVVVATAAVAGVAIAYNLTSKAAPLPLYASFFSALPSLLGSKVSLILLSGTPFRMQAIFAQARYISESIAITLAQVARSYRVCFPMAVTLSMYVASHGSLQFSAMVL